MNEEQTVKQNADAYYFHEGTATRAHEYLGAHRIGEHDGRYVYAFRTFAHRANSVELAGDLNSWGGTPLTRISESGIFELLYESDIPLEGTRYKYRIFSDNSVRLKADPLARYSEWGSRTASILWSGGDFEWHDKKWLDLRRGISKKKGNFCPYPINIYEVHLGSFKTKDGKSTANGEAYLNYGELAKDIARYARNMGYTHIMLMPVIEHPKDASWGYVATGFFAPTSRFGNPNDFKLFVEILHEAKIGVILDLPLFCFASDEHGLADFDGHRMYEYQREQHGEGGTRYFDLGRKEVRSFLISCALFWLREYHIDGLQAHGLSSVLYLDNGEKSENKIATDLIKSLNKAVFSEFPDVLMIADDNTAWPLVTAPVEAGGLGFNFRHNVGWTRDIMDYMSTDPYFRAGKHNELTFSVRYSFGENYILSITHGEVTGGKGALIDKMFGGYDDKFAQMRVFLSYMMTYPGKKMTFMGSEFGQLREWEHDNQLEWFLFDFEAHKKLSAFCAQLNRFYLSSRPLWEKDFSPEGFEWVCENSANENVIAYRRIGVRGELLCVLNFSPVTYNGFELFIGDRHKFYREMLNSDLWAFGGKGRENRGLLECENGKIALDIPPLSGLILAPLTSDDLSGNEVTVKMSKNI